MTMNLTLSYLGRSAIRTGPAGVAVSLVPNLRRDRVGYLGTLRQPLRFREAVSTLHDVVVSDLRFHEKDHTAYREYLARLGQREEALRGGVAGEVRSRLLDEGDALLAKQLEPAFDRMRRLYWEAREKYSTYLLWHDPELWRMLVPCDPVITVAPDVIFFEGFSKDESSYGCLTVERGAFTREEGVHLGTTNVDYSIPLYEEFQKLRTYRETRFRIDPKGFEVRTAGSADYREEKIDLPTSWLRGFMRLQSAMSLPMRRVPVSREGLYNVLAWLKRHRARKSPRAVRFELEPGRPVALVLEPWDQRIVLHDTPYRGPRAEVIRTWGRDRLHVLARLLPLADGADVYLLGTGLPSFWSVRLGEMRFLLGLSGWTANDWTGAGALDQLAPPLEPSAELLADVAAAFKDHPTRTFEEVCSRTGASAPYAAAALNRLALMGQVIHDLAAGAYRWRPVMPAALLPGEVGPESPETVAGRELVAAGRISLTRDERSPTGLRLLAGSVGKTTEKPLLGGLLPQAMREAFQQVSNESVEAVLDGDGRILRGKCGCPYHRQAGLRRGPCRHLQALRRVALGERPAPTTLESWFSRLWN
jgi:hypothetical protein